MKLTAEVCILESLNLLDESHRREGEILSRTLRLSEKNPHYVYVRSRVELERFAIEFKREPFRYLHLSCHGSAKGFRTTLDRITNEEMVAILGPAMKGGRRLFMSSCKAADPSNGFAESLLRNSECRSVIAPVESIPFDDAAIFWSSFYHLMFKREKGRMRGENIVKSLDACSSLVGQEFRYFRKDDEGQVVASTHPEE